MAGIAKTPKSGHPKSGRVAFLPYTAFPLALIGGRSRPGKSVRSLSTKGNMLAGFICSDPCWCHGRWSTCGVYWRGAEHRVHRTCDSDGIRRRVARRAARGPHGRFGGSHLYRSCQSARATLGSDRWQRHLGCCRRWDSLHGVIAWACEWPGSRRCNPGDVTAALSAPSWRGCCTDRGDGRSCGHHSRLDVPANASGD